jgi:CheY-like chemotaxis protein
MPEYASNSKSRILLVEDNPSNIMVAALFLEQYGYIYDVAYTGEEAIEKAKKGGYSTIIMDVQMQGVDGLEATRRIRQFEANSAIQRTPIIGMTAYALTGDRERCLDVGMDDYISKPFNPSEFEQKLLTFTSLKKRAA